MRSSDGISPSTNRVTSHPSGSTKDDDLGADPERRGRLGGCELDRAIDPEQVRVLSRHAQHEVLAVDVDLEVVVRDAAAEHLEPRATTRPDPLDLGRERHARIRSPRGSKSGSSATMPGTHSPKISTVTSVPTPYPAGRYAYAIELLDGIAVPTARHATDGLTLDPDGLRAERDGAWVFECEAAQHAFRLAAIEERVAADEVALVELDGEAEPRLERRVLGRDVRAPHPISLLEAQRVDRLVAARDESVLAAGGPDRCPRARARTPTRQ